MRYLLDALYLLSLLALAPWLLYRTLRTGRYRRGGLGRLIGTVPLSPSSCRRVWFHGVSVGEIHLLRQMSAGFRRRRPDWQCVVSTTTETGFDEATKHFPDLPIIFWPFDFSWTVRRALRQVKPELVVLAESELWPNFLAAANQLGVPVVVINGRMSPRSFRRLRLLAPFSRVLFRGPSLFAVQNEDFAERVRLLGAAPERVHVTGNIKYDGVTGDRHHPRVEELRRLLAIRSDDLVWVVGSTQAPEEETALDIFLRQQSHFPFLRLVLVPRHRERFDEVAELLVRRGVPFVRRSTLTAPPPDRPAVVLVDTFGELEYLWGLADLAFVGGSLDGKRGGQNMIQPAAYGAAVLFGPHVWNFRRDAALLVAAGAAVQVGDAANLERVVVRLLGDPAERRRLGDAARRLVRSQQGATERTLDLLEPFLRTRSNPEEAA